jgi:hypothetical protein
MTLASTPTGHVKKSGILFITLFETLSFIREETSASNPSQSPLVRGEVDNITAFFRTLRRLHAVAPPRDAGSFRET